MASAWSMWELTPDIVISTFVVAIIYGVGIARRRTTPTQSQAPRHVAFYTGLAVVFIALQSPIDTISEHLFAMHQVQHLLLRMLGPMLIVLAAPQARLISGLPGWARKGLLTPIASSRGVQTVFSFLGHPFVVTTLFIGVLYFWEIPYYHDLALLNEPLHYAMHMTMLIVGLIFYSRIFDPRAAPAGLHYGVRLLLLWLVLFSNIALGAYTTLKTAVLYGAYDVLGRFWGIPAAMDERLGGIIIWGPGSMMCVVAMLIVIHLWGRRESRVEERQSGTPSNLSVAAALSGRSLRAGQKSNNRAMAFGFVGFVFAVFTAVLFVGILDHALGGPGRRSVPAAAGLPVARPTVPLHSPKLSSLATSIEFKDRYGVSV